MEKHWHSASNNGLGGVAHADNWAYVMESVEHFLNGFSDSDDSDDEVSPLSTQSGSALSQSDVTESVVRFLNGLIDADDSDDEVPHLSTQSGSPLSQSEYESAVEDFEALENQWLNEPDCLQQKTLYKSVFDAEVTFAIKFGLIHSYDVLEQENPRNVYMLSWLVRELQRSFGVGHMILDFAQEHSIFNVFKVDDSLCREDVYVSISDVEGCVELVHNCLGECSTLRPRLSL